LGQLREVESKLTELGYQIVIMSPDRPEKIREFNAKGNYAYTILSDSDLVAARALGVAFRVSDKGFEALKSYDLDIEDASGKQHHLLPVPAIFIVDTEGAIRFEYVNPDYRVRIDPGTLLAAAEADAKARNSKK
jgi:peroxiredoxin